ncbi:ester cyclase [Roseococcus pinisoli]|uniref:Ester cyclase n=1 Tax=Roseococcus pinisoli TaxID=2835040 RepID=A0ABS5QHK4_9PROT|nr:ester cyclase [Roseococcus pinisoli]MBS7813084.1 ester cyclase [Roseococcus pinisoli]
MPPSAGTILRLWFEEVWNRKDVSLIETYFAPDGVTYALDLSGADARGPAAFQAFFEEFLASFPDIHFTVHDVVEDGDRAAGRWSARLTHSGDGFGFTASGETVTVTGMSMVRVENGMMVESWNEWDRLRLATACRMTAPA